MCQCKVNKFCNNAKKKLVKGQNVCGGGIDNKRAIDEIYSPFRIIQNFN